jgi:hypothetical protein
VWEYETGKSKTEIELDLLYSALTNKVTGKISGSRQRVRYTSLDLNYYELDNICNNGLTWEIYLEQEVSQLYN